MNTKTKQNLIIVIVGVALFAGLMNLSTVLSFSSKIVGLILPIIVGGILALFINVPTTGLENLFKRLLSRCKKTPSNTFFHVAGFVVTMLCVAIVLALVFILLIPELIDASKVLVETLEVRIPEWLDMLDKHDINANWLRDILSKLDIKQIAQNSSERIASLMGGVTSTLSSVFSGILTAVFGFIIAIYLVLDKNRVCRHSKKLLFAYVKPSYADKIANICNKFAKSFRKFLTVQCGEALILGTLMSISFLIFKIPYAGLAGLLTVICAIIPYVGAFISFSVCVFLSLLVDPMIGLRCAIIYVVVQFIENQFIYPRVVGNSVGLPPLYTLVAALIGGKLFGIMGILFFIPIAAVVFEMVNENINTKIQMQKNTLKTNDSV